jgi:predicted DNA-binding transcriptional regulator YafY
VARNDQIVRILTVARALAQSRRGISLKSLAERHGWLWRSVYRDVEALERAGFPVEREDGRHRLMSGWNAPTLPGIEPDEILALYSVRALAESWRATALGRPLDRLWMKLTASGTGQGALLPITREPWFAVRSPLAIDYRAHDKIIAVFDKAARDRLAVSCRYRALSTREITARTIEPGELYWDPTLESLYVIGWCRLRAQVRIFAVHRFLAAALTDEPFAPRAETRSKAALRNAFRVWRGNVVETVRVRFSRGSADEIRERTWGPGQKIEEEGDGAVVLTLEVAGLAEVQRWVLGYGAAAEVLEPDELRLGVAHQVDTAAQKYAGAADTGARDTATSRSPAKRARRAKS